VRLGFHTNGRQNALHKHGECRETAERARGKFLILAVVYGYRLLCTEVPQQTPPPPPAHARRGKEKDPKKKSHANPLHKCASLPLQEQRERTLLVPLCITQWYAPCAIGLNPTMSAKLTMVYCC
jgi:hypothetical protein